MEAVTETVVAGSLATASAAWAKMEAAMRGMIPSSPSVPIVCDFPDPVCP